jgi:hypothetical protein
MAAETAQQKTARETAEKTVAQAFSALTRIGHPTDAFGSPMVEITAGAAELVPTVQYGNATIGPVMIRRYVPDGPPETLKGELKRTMEMVEAAVAEDRETLHAQLRAAGGQ